MSKRDIPFYATEADIIDLCDEVSVLRKIQFNLYGLIDINEVSIFTYPIQLKKHNTYLISDIGIDIKNRAVPQKNGDIKYISDTVNNVNSIYIHMGGLLESNKLLQGALGNINDNDIAIGLDLLFRKIIKKKFTKIKSHYVGHEACNLLDSGFRLCSTKNSPESYDLKR